MQTAAEARSKFQAKINSLTNEQVEASLVALNRPRMTEHEITVRVALLDLYEARQGVEAADVLMDKLEAMED